MRAHGLNRLWREPLLHFLAIGAGLFFVYGAVVEDGARVDTNRIEVDREALLTFMQYRAKTFDSARFNAMLDASSAPERQALIDDYVREEALYREAKALGLDENDYVARKRLVQQLEFITRGFITEGTRLSEEELQAYLVENAARYFVAPEITFTHVFFNTERHGAEKAEELAQATLKELTAKQIAFHEAISWGDRFLYHRNYVGKKTGEIASHFGAAMQDGLFALDGDGERWHGPFESPYGFHLAMVTKRTDGHAPELDAVRVRVEQDALQARLKTELDKTLASIADGYEVDVADELKQAPLAETAGGSR